MSTRRNPGTTKEGTVTDRPMTATEQDTMNRLNQIPQHSSRLTENGPDAQGSHPPQRELLGEVERLKVKLAIVMAQEVKLGRALEEIVCEATIALRARVAELEAAMDRYSEDEMLCRSERYRTELEYLERQTRHDGAMADKAVNDHILSVLR